MKLREMKTVEIDLDDDLIEKLSDTEYKSWASWMKYLFNKSKKNPDGSVTIPKESVKRWERQMKTNYKDLTKSEKDSDRHEVKRQMNIIGKH